MHIWARWLAELPATLQQLIARRHRISLPHGVTPAVRVARLRAALCTPHHVQALYYTLPAACQVALQQLRQTPHGLNADYVDTQFGPLRPLAALRADPHPRSTTEQLVLAGWLLPRPVARNHPLHYCLPPELRLWLPTPLAVGSDHVTVTVPTTVPVPPAAVAAAVILVTAAEHPLTFFGAGSLGVDALRRLVARLDPHAVSLVRWLVPLLCDLRLLVGMGTTLVAAPTVAAFLRRPLIERARLLQEAWLATRHAEAWLALPTRARTSLDWPALRRRLLVWTAELPVGVALDPAPLYAHCAAAFGPLTRGLGHTARARPRTPWHADRSAAVWDQALVGPLTWLGLVRWEPEDAPQEERRCWVTRLAQAPLEPFDPALAPVLDAPAPPWQYGAAGTLMIPLVSVDATVLDLLPFASWAAATPTSLHYTIDHRTLARATAAGYARSALQALLAQKVGPLPDMWVQLVTEPAAARVQIIHAAIALTDDAQVLDRAVQQRSVRRYVAHHVAPGVVLVEPTDVAGLSRALTRAALAVTIRGTAHPPPAAALTPAECALLVEACDFFRTHGPGNDHALEQLSARLRAQLPATQLAPPPQATDEHAPPLTAWPTTLPDDPVAALRAALGQRRAVQVVYQAAQAATPTPRTVRPLRLELIGAHWYLHAFCLAKQRALTFRVDRMQALQVLERVPMTASVPRTQRMGKRSRGRRRGVFAAPVRAPHASGGAWLEP